MKWWIISHSFSCCCSLCWLNYSYRHKAAMQPCNMWKKRETPAFRCFGTFYTSPVERKHVPKEVSQVQRRGGVRNIKAVLSGALRAGRGWGAGQRDGGRVFSHLTNQVIHWSTCASAQFSCPCFWGSQTSVWAARRSHWYPETPHLKGRRRRAWVIRCTNQTCSRLMLMCHIIRGEQRGPSQCLSNSTQRRTGRASELRGWAPLSDHTAFISLFRTLSFSNKSFITVCADASSKSDITWPTFSCLKEEMLSLFVSVTTAVLSVRTFAPPTCVCGKCSLM